MRSLRVSVCGLLLTLLPALAQAIPPIQHWTQDDGARVYFVATDALPIVDVRLTFDAAAARDGKLPGLARLTSSLLDQGNDGLDAGEVAARFEQVGARLSGGSERDMAWLQLRSLSEPKALNTAIDTLALVLGKPDFPPAAVERNRKQMLVGLQAVQQSPDELGMRAFYPAIYGDHPYANPPSGTEESVAAISRDDVVAFYRRYYTAPNAVIALTGDLSREQAAAIARKLSAGLPRGEAPPPLPPVRPSRKGGQVRVPFSSTQTHVLIGQPAIDRNSPDYFAFTVGNHVLGGGGLVSLLNQAMREQRGLSYSSASYFVPSARPGPFIISTQVRNERVDEALEVIGQLFRQLRSEGPSKEQLDAAKRNITGGFPLSLDSNSDIVGQLAAIGFYRLPLDYLDNYVKRIEQVSAEDVRKAFQTYLDPDAMTTVLVGPEPRQPAAKP